MIVPRLPIPPRCMELRCTKTGSALWTTTSPPKSATERAGELPKRQCSRRRRRSSKANNRGVRVINLRLGGRPSHERYRSCGGACECGSRQVAATSGGGDCRYTDRKSRERTTATSCCERFFLSQEPFCTQNEAAAETELYVSCRNSLTIYGRASGGKKTRFLLLGTHR